MLVFSTSHYVKKRKRIKSIDQRIKELKSELQISTYDYVWEQIKLDVKHLAR